MKEYLTPQVRLIHLDAEALLAGSGDPGTIQGYNVQSTNNAYSNRSDEGSRSFWDE